MPNGIVPDEGLARGLFRTLKNEDTDLFPWELGLFVNDVTPDAETVLADLVEPSWDGYARKTMNNDLWTAPTVEDHVATSTWREEVSEFPNATGAPQFVFGYFIADPFFGVLRLVQRFDPADIREIGPGDAVRLLPVLKRWSQAP